MKHPTEALWLNCTTERPVGIVKTFDEIEGCWKYYIGTGIGRDLDEDIQLIMDWGSKYYDLGFITAWAEAPGEEDAGHD